MFIHGPWLHAASWDAWVKLFRRLGYVPLAPGWPNEPGTIHEARLMPERVAGVGIAEITEHYARIIRTLDTPPIVIGHSYGGLVAQQLLGGNLARAVIAIDAVQPQGVWSTPVAQLRSLLPVLYNPFNLYRSTALTASDFRYVFGNMLSLEDATELYTQWSIPSPGRPLFQAAFANLHPHAVTKLPPATAGRGPLLLIGGSKDHLVPSSITRAVYQLHRSNSSAQTDLFIFADRGHSLVVDAGWRDVADYCLDWIKRVVLPPEPEVRPALIPEEQTPKTPTPKSRRKARPDRDIGEPGMIRSTIGI
jgi:pimeloyl-ACP methyl ester carboxylesterase